MLFKVQRCSEAPDFVIYDDVKTINYGKRSDNDYSTPDDRISGIWCELDLFTREDTSSSLEIFEKVGYNGSTDKVFIEDNTILLIDRDLYMKSGLDPKGNPLKHFLNWVKITDSNNCIRLVMFDGTGYICNDKGKTIEVIK